MPTPTAFLANGSPLVSTAAIYRRNEMIKFLNPEKLTGEVLMAGAFARIQSCRLTTYTVWLLDDRTMNTVMLEVPLHLMGQYFKAHPHNIFPHLR